MTSANVDAVVTTCDGSNCGWDMGILRQKLGAVELCVGAGRFDDQRLLVEVEHLMCCITYVWDGLDLRRIEPAT